MEDPRNANRNTARWNIDKVRFHLDKPIAPARETKRIDSIIRDVVADLEETQSGDMLVIREAWQELAGKQIAHHSAPASLDKHVLSIHVDHPGWMPELERMKRQLLHKLQSRYPDLRIRQLRFILLHR